MFGCKTVARLDYSTTLRVVLPRHSRLAESCNRTPRDLFSDSSQKYPSDTLRLHPPASLASGRVGASPGRAPPPLRLDPAAKRGRVKIG